eukprot:Gb_41638 [translate_table: standard]
MERCTETDLERGRAFNVGVVAGIMAHQTSPLKSLRDVGSRSTYPLGKSYKNTCWRRTKGGGRVECTERLPNCRASKNL